MAIQVNTIGVDKIRGLIRANKINTNSSWSFTANDGNKLLGANDNDWENFADHHLTIDTDETKDTKNYWKFPVAKDGVIYRSGLIAAKQRAAQQGYDNIEEIADELLQMVDEKTELKWHKKLYNQLRELIKPQSEQKAVKQTGGFFVRKQLDGTYRWFGIVTNKFADLEDEILTDSAHVEFLDYLNENPQKAPELWSWHTPGTARKHKTDWWEYANGFFMYSGKLTPDEGLFYENIETKQTIGMSHGFYVLEKFGKLITKYRTFEVSELPLGVAANPFTFFDVENMEVITMAFSTVKRQFLADRYGEDVVAQLEGSVEDAEKALEAVGTDWKQLNREYEAQIEEKLAERVQTAAEPQVAKIVKAVVKALRDDLVTLNERIGGLDEQIKTASKLEAAVNEITEKVNHLMETKDTWIADALSAGNPFDSPTKSNQNTISEEDLESDLLAKVKEAAAGEGWLQNMSPFDGGTQ